MALTKLTTDLIDGSLGTDWQTTPKTAAFTATAGEGYFVNTTSAAITVTLPSSPTAGDEVSVVDYAGTADTNNITITSSNNINGSSNDVLIDYERGGVSMVYVDATQGWIAYNANNETAEALIDVPPAIAVDYLVVAGGGSGGSQYGGGGGAGGLRTSYGSTSGGGSSAESSLSLATAANYTVTVGAGGAGALNSEDANIGFNSVFSIITSDGGGSGGKFYGGSTPSTGGSTGGSGGGGGMGLSSGVTTAGGLGIANQGFDGGDGYRGSSSDYRGGGGGGASASGQDALNAGGSTGGNGGAGLSVSITGSAVTYAGGGGGMGQSTGGTGGAGGGGNGSNGVSYNGSTIDGDPNTGGGGGGMAPYIPPNDSGNGGSGVVIIRYPNTFTVAIGSGLTGSTATDGSDKVTTFTAGTGNISFS